MKRMKNAVVSLLLVSICLFGCGQSKTDIQTSVNDTNVSEDGNESTQSENSSDQSEEQNDKGNNNNEGVGDGSDGSSDADEEQSDKSKSVKIGESIKLDFAKMTLKKLEVARKYKFKYVKKSGWFKSTRTSEIEPDSGMMLVCLKGKFTNKSKKKYIPANTGVFGKMIINGNEYDTTMECYNVKKAEGIYEIASQRTVSYFLYAEVPKKVAKNIDSCTVQIGFSQDLENKPVFNMDEYDYLYQIDEKPSKAK